MKFKSFRPIDRSPALLVRAAYSPHRTHGGQYMASKTLSLVLAVFFVADGVSAAQPSARPDFAAIRRAVEEHFQSTDDYEPGDLVTQSQVQAALKSVVEAGWKVPSAGRVVELALPDRSFLAGQFATRDGRKFMRKVAHHSGGYVRLDHLSTTSSGQRLIRDLISQKDGDKFIEYLATTPGGRRLGSMLANTRQGTDLNKRTGHIYTVDDLLTVLQDIYTKTK